MVTPPLPEPVDQIVYLPGGHGVETRCGFVEEHDGGVAQQGTSQSDPLAETLGETAAEIPGAVTEVDGLERVGDPGLGVVQAVEAGEVLQVLGHGEAQVQPGRLGHDRDAPADLDPVLRIEGDPRHGRRARGRGEQCAEGADRCRLARAIGAEEPEHLAAEHLEGDLGEGGPPAEALGERVHGEDGFTVPLRQWARLAQGCRAGLRFCRHTVGQPRGEADGRRISGRRHHTRCVGQARRVSRASRVGRVGLIGREGDPGVAREQAGDQPDDGTLDDERMLGSGPARESDDLSVAGIKEALGTGQQPRGPHAQAVTSRLDGKLEGLALTERSHDVAVDRHLPWSTLVRPLAGS